jgi:nucleoside-diphosphate-sugar epimerase
VLVRKLLADGNDVTVVDWGHRRISPWLTRTPDGLRIVAEDVRTVDWSKVLRAGDSVVHLAALVGDPACARDPKSAETVNNYSSLRLADAIAELGGKHLVFASTCSNYGARPVGGDPVDESTELKPLSLYARTKVAVEQKLLQRNYPYAVDILRFSTLFGLSPSMRFDLTVNEFTRDLTLGRDLLVYSPQSWRPYVHIQDASNVIAECLTIPPSVIRVLNVGNDANNSTKIGIVQTIDRVLRHSGSVSVTDGGDDGRNYRVSFERIKKTLTTSVDTGIEQGVIEIHAAITSGVFDDPFAARFSV